MKFRKRLIRSNAIQGLLCGLTVWYVRLVHATGRWRTIGREIPERFWRENKPFIVTFWHGRLMMMPAGWRSASPVHMLVSLHPDGRFFAGAAERFGISNFGGSSTRGGMRAVRALLAALDRGECIAITPDGPRGPRMRVSGAIIEIARRSGAPIIPTANACSRRRVFGSWDRFVVALPFGRGVFAWGEPIEVPAGADAGACEIARCEVEDALNALTAEADRLVGQDYIAPAPAVVSTARAVGEGPRP